ncbi:MAG: HD domain-containing protein [Kiritimatiellae bacterium]|nr:HD domain-containing protein [Kiritimatiellia bacterium]
MTEEFLKELKAKYDAYVETFAPLEEMMELKRVHTDNVLKNAEEICAAEGFGDEMARTCRAAALLHDTGRYEQLRRYNTFRDSESVDHADFSHDIVVEKGWLAALEGKERNAILAAVLVHNKRDIPESEMDELTLAAAKVVRDADKLDIFRVLETQLAKHDWRKDARAFWNLPAEARPSAEVTDAIKNGRPVDYGFIRSIPDFVLIQVGWMASGLYYAASHRICAERGHLEFRRRFLKTLTDDPAVDEICDIANETLNKTIARGRDEAW